MKWIILCTTLLTLAACEKLAVWYTPKQKADLRKTPLSIQAEQYFWNTLHQGQSDSHRRSRCTADGSLFAKSE